MFEHSLIELETRTQPRSRRWLSLPLAVGVHLVALTGFALASYWNVGSVPDPELNMSAFVVTLPPPAIQQGGGPRPSASTPHPQAPSEPPPLQQPKEETAPAKPLDTPTAPSAPQDPGPVLTDDPAVPPGPGPINGDPHSHNSTGVAEGPAEPVDDPPLRLTAEISRPQALRPILPRYTEPARRAGMQGTVVVEAIIDEQGRATDVRILRGLPMGLDRAAVEAIQQTPFKPAMMGNRPVKVYFTLTVNFAIQR
jgi:protein TonB